MLQLGDAHHFAPYRINTLMTSLAADPRAIDSGVSPARIQWLAGSQPLVWGLHY